MKYVLKDRPKYQPKKVFHDFWTSSDDSRGISDTVRSVQLEAAGEIEGAQCFHMFNTYGEKLIGF